MRRSATIGRWARDRWAGTPTRPTKTEPAFGTLLYALEIPSHGGETEFSDLNTAYERLPGPLHDQVESQRVVYSIDASGISQEITATAEQRRLSPDVAHPLVRRHPYRDTRALYLSPDHTVTIEGEDPETRSELLDELISWVTRPEFRYSHRWRIGDVVMWDNTRVIHRRTSFPPGERRVLKRTGFMLPPDLARPF